MKTIKIQHTGDDKWTIYEFADDTYEKLVKWFQSTPVTRFISTQPLNYNHTVSINLDHVIAIVWDD